MDHKAQQLVVVNELISSKTNYKADGMKSAYYNTLKECNKPGDWAREFKHEYAEKPDWTLIEKLPMIDAIHGHDSSAVLQTFQLCSLFACYSNEDYENCLNWVIDNCNNISDKSKMNMKYQYPTAEAVRQKMKATFAANSQLKKKIQQIELKGWVNSKN